MIWMPLYIHIVFSFLAAVGFAVFLNSPRKTLFISGSVRMISWTIYILLMRSNFDTMFSNFIAAFIASTLCEILSRKFKKPTILFVIPGIITLIPGLGLYNTMFYMIQNNFQEAMTIGSNVMFASGSIALGVLVASSMFRTYSRLEYKKFLISGKILNSHKEKPIND